MVFNAGLEVLQILLQLFDLVLLLLVLLAQSFVVDVERIHFVLGVLHVFGLVGCIFLHHLIVIWVGRNNWLSVLALGQGDSLLVAVLKEFINGWGFCLLGLNQARIRLSNLGYLSRLDVNLMRCITPIFVLLYLYI